MFVAKIENTKKQILTLTQNESQFQVYNIQGLNPPNAAINFSKVAGLDGSRFNSAKLEERNIVIYIKLNGDIEANRLYLYTFFNTKEWCKFYYKNGSRDVYIEGYVETAECDLFTNNEIMQISIICPNPYFKAMQEIVDDISKALAAFVFPFSINQNEPIAFSTIDTSKVTNVYNDSESETGVIIEIDVLGNVNTIMITNISSGETFKLSYSFMENDKVIIDTNVGEKSITLIRNGIKYNIFAAINKGSNFFQLSIGDNWFSYLVDDGDNDNLIHIAFKHYTLYRGV
ncbi:MAG: phage tail family protein [Clostridia bacterium]|nr:phage tail family protein [Clostridia bacterium]